MRIAYFDCFAGIAGDMVIGALLDAGLDFAFLEEELTKLGVSGYALRRTRVKRHHIVGTKFDVVLEQNVPFHSHEMREVAERQSGHSDDEDKHHHAGQEEPHDHESHPHVHRKLGDVMEIIERAGLSSQAKDRSIRIFTRLAEAEARMHDMPVDEVQFHEVGAVDAIVDIVGACIGIECLGIERVHASPIRVGRGTITVAHGTMPVPAPGTLELLRGVPVEHTDIPFELVTPTGAAIITTLAEGFGTPPAFVPEKVGYGAGGRDPKEIANLLRVEIGETVERGGHDEVVVLETNIDDMTPEVYGYVMERLLAAGAKDVFFVPVIMKKNRPGIVLNVITDAATKDRMISVIFQETPTLGVRIATMPRRILARESGTVETPWGTIRVKKAEWDGEVRVTPEYDDCVAVARKHGVPILHVYEAVRRASP